MPYRQKSITRLLQCTAFFAAIVVGPSALAQDYGYGHRHAHADGYVARHHHIATHANDRRAATQLRHGSGRYLEAAYRKTDERERPITAELNLIQSRKGRERAAEIAASIADQHERPVTAELNLVQLQAGRERAAEIARWQLRYGGAQTSG